MKHSFKPSQLDANICVECKHPEIDHTPLATCDACGKTEVCDVFRYKANNNETLLCEKCWNDEAIAESLAYQSPDLQQVRLEESKLKQIKKVDSSITLSIDLFNAATIAHVEALRAIDDDPSIPPENKAFAKCQFMVERIAHFEKLWNEFKEAVVKTDNVVAAGHTLLNSMMNDLRAEERAKLKLKDLNYPVPPKKTPKPKATGTKAVVAKISAKEIIRQANEWGAKIDLPGQAVHMRMIAMKMTAEQAARTLAAELGLTVKE